MEVIEIKNCKRCGKQPTYFNQEFKCLPCSELRAKENLEALKILYQNNAARIWNEEN